MRVNKWYTNDKYVKIFYENNKIIVKNESGKEGKIFSINIFRVNHKFLNVEFDANVLSGAGAFLTFINRKKERKMNVIIGAKASSKVEFTGFLMPMIIIKPYSEIEINFVTILMDEIKSITYNHFLGKKKVLLITPLYPSPDNLYACGFVHTRVKAYVDLGLDVEVAVINSYSESSFYTFEGIDVFKTDYDEMRNILMSKFYDCIFVHFLDSIYAKYLLTSYLTDTPIFLWNHGADILFKDYKEFYSPYFSNDYVLPESLKIEYDSREKFINELVKLENVHWIFVSNWEKKRAENLLNIKFKNSEVIHNFIDSNIFKYCKKDAEQRKKIFMVRRFDNTKKYAIDIVVLTILELSRRDFFNDLTFYLCGEGDYFEELVSPICNFDNVIINNNFLSHKQIYEYHKDCGIGLFPTRQDTQGVSALEAASSGLVVISSDIPVINEFFDCNLGTLCEVDNYIMYADVIEKLYYNPKEFEKISSKMSENTRKACSFDNTIKKEFSYVIRNKFVLENLISIPNSIDSYPLLTIVIPAYNASKYLVKCLLSILKSTHLGKLEILIINDGSTDDTSKIGEYFEKALKNNTRKIVKLINKENGGHGSGINKGLELAEGKYFRVVDSDDWIDTEQFDSYIEKLKYEDADEVLTDYCEARTFEDKLHSVNTFEFMCENVKYNVNDICSGEYGFRVWGPSLPTATYKTSVLRKTNFKLPEHMFYVDMLYNAYSIINVNTIVKYSENIYRYYIGNVGQSVSASGMKKHYKDHENVIINLMDIIENDDRLTAEKRKYILNMLLLPMVVVQYNIYMDVLRSGKKFMVFERRIKKYKSITACKEFNAKRIRFYRRTYGLFVPFHPIINRVLDSVRRK